MTLLRRQFLKLTAGSVVAPALSSFALAQTYPARPVRLLVPYAPAGPADILARVAAQKLSEQLGSQFYVENVGGAGGNIGMGQGARAVADGYTVLVVPPNIVVNPAMYDTVPYDPYKDFDPVTIAVSAPTVLSSASVAGGPNGQGPCCTDQVRRHQVQLRVARHRHAATSDRRAFPPVAWARPRTCAVQQRGPGRRIDASPGTRRLHSARCRPPCRRSRTANYVRWP